MGALLPRAWAVACTLAAFVSHAQCARFSANDWRRALRSVDIGPGGASVGGVVVVVVCAVFSALLVVAIAVAAVWRKIGPRRGQVVDLGKAEAAMAAGKGKAGKGGDAPEAGLSSLLCLSFNDVQVATEGFKTEGLLSDKPHSSVHRAEGPNGEKWAVKRAKGGSIIGEHLFRNEVDFLAKVTHPSILEFQAYSDDCNEQILVFQFMSNGSIASWLRPPPEFSDRAPLSFETRVSIAVDIAEALCFLHSFSKPTIIHRDVVSESVLLDANFKAKLGSLGLLKHLPGEGLWMRMAQKKGYLDPEYFQTFKVTAKCDVYSFGVVLLELLTGCPPVIQSSRADSQRPITLPQWASQTMSSGNLEELIDPRMPRTEGGFTMQKVQKFAQIACDCVAQLRKNRPEMIHVSASLRDLKGAAESARSGFLPLMSNFITSAPKVTPA